MRIKERMWGCYVITKKKKTWRDYWYFFLCCFFNNHLCQFTCATICTNLSSNSEFQLDYIYVSHFGFCFAQANTQIGFLDRTFRIQVETNICTNLTG